MSIAVPGPPLRHETRRDRFAAIDPGDTPPLSAQGERVPDRRRVSLRWLAGSVLTGVFGATLMIGAVMAAFDGEATFARVPSLASAPLRDETEGGLAGINGQRKADRILMQAETVAAHQIIRLSTTTRIGDKDVIKVKPFARVMATLSLTAGDLAADVPPFNPLKIMADANAAPAAADAPPIEDDGEVTVTMSDLSAIAVGVDAGPTLSLEQVQAGVGTQTAFEAGATAVTVPPQLLNLDPVAGDSDAALPYAVPDVDAASALEVSIVPENVTTIGKTEASGAPPAHEQTVMLQRGDTFAGVLAKLGAGEADIAAVKAALGSAADAGEGQRLSVLMDVETPGGPRRPVRVSVFNADQHLGTVALSDEGQYVAVADPDATSVAQAQEDDDPDAGGGIRLYNAIYETALKQKVPRDMIDALLRIYAYDIDLTRRTRPGDAFEVFYEQDEAGNPVGDVLYTSLSIDGDLKRYFRYVTPDDGQVDYYDEQGRSARKFLMRKPISGGEMRSTFGMRRHPVLGYYKMHTGVDWADRVGTPILATGNGTIVKAGWTNGYGRHIEIQHANGYLTTYSHMQGFAKGMEPGVRVTLGQVIGYLGSSGLSTGPHCHYEVKINGNFVDPMRIKLPQGRELGGGTLAAFKTERERIEDMMTRAPVAQTTVQPTVKGT